MEGGGNVEHVGDTAGGHGGGGTRRGDTAGRAPHKTKQISLVVFFRRLDHPVSSSRPDGRAGPSIPSSAAPHRSASSLRPCVLAGLAEGRVVWSAAPVGERLAERFLGAWYSVVVRAAVVS